MLFTPENRAKGVPEIERDTAHNLGCASDERWHIRKDGVRFFASGVQTAAEQYAATSDTALYQAWGFVAASMRRSTHIVQLVGVAAWIFVLYYSFLRHRLIPRPLAPIHTVAAIWIIVRGLQKDGVHAVVKTG